MLAKVYLTYVTQKCLTIVGVTRLNRSDKSKSYIISKSMVLLFDYHIPLNKLEGVNNHSRGVHKSSWVRLGEE